MSTDSEYFSVECFDLSHLSLKLAYFFEKIGKTSKKLLQNRRVCDRMCFVNRGIAQLVEYRSPKPWVAGSNPPAPAKQKNAKPQDLVFFCFAVRILR